MAYNEMLAKRINSKIGNWQNITEKKMFGGVGFMLNGNMLCGVYKEFLILRVEPEVGEKLLTEPHTKVFDITGKVMKGWIMVKPEGCKIDSELERYIDLAKDFVDTLPAK